MKKPAVGKRRRRSRLVFKNALIHVFGGKVPGSIDMHDVYEKQASKD